MPATIISLTTIPSRMDRIRPTLESLLRQRAAIDAVILWIPRVYRRPEFREFTPPDVPAGVDVRRCDIDYGPATKVLPAVAAFPNRDVRILYCDDDRIYDPEWAARFIEASDAHPEACIAAVGEVIGLTLKKAFKATPTYRMLARGTLGVFSVVYRSGMRALEIDSGRVDICKGYGGSPDQRHFLNSLPADERLVSLGRSGPGVRRFPERPKRRSRPAAMAIFTLRRRPSPNPPLPGFDAWRPPPLRGCECRSRAGRPATLERRRDRHGSARAHPSRWAGRARATPVAVRAVRPNG